MGPKAVAKKITVVPQNGYIPFPFSVFEVVLDGREPHMKRFSGRVGRFSGLSPMPWKLQDLPTLHKVVLIYLRRETEGNRCRALPRVGIFDEPTSHLDPGYQIEIMDVFKSLAESITSGVLAVPRVNSHFSQID